MKLTPDVIDELAKLRADIKTKIEKEKELTEKLKKLMQQKKLEVFQPSESPFKLILSECDRTSVSWKDQWKKLAKKVYGSSWRRKEKKLMNFKIPVTSLLVEPNEEYNAQ